MGGRYSVFSRMCLGSALSVVHMSVGRPALFRGTDGGSLGIRILPFPEELRFFGIHVYVLYVWS